LSRADENKTIETLKLRTTNLKNSSVNNWPKVIKYKLKIKWVYAS